MLWLSLFSPLFIAFLFISIIWPRHKTVSPHLLIKSCLAVGAGLGISSFSFFLGLVVFPRSSDGFVTAEMIFFAILTVVLLYLYAIRTRKDPAPRSTSKPASKAGLVWILFAPFYIALIAAMIVFIFLSLDSPHGEWDAWAIWNMRARFLFRSGLQWTHTFSNLVAWSHPDYPLLIPAVVARCWAYIGHETVVVPAVVSMLFTFATVGLLFSSLSILRSRSQGFLAGLVLLGTPLFIRQGASQQADVPLGFFFLATIVLFFLQDRLSKSDYSLVYLAGMTAGFSAWTKHEGLLFLACIIVSRLAIMVPVRDRKVFLRQAFSFAAGLAPILATVIYFKTQLASPNEFISLQGLQVALDRLTDGSRYLQVGKAWAGELIYLGNWIFSLPLLLVFYLLAMGINIDEKNKPALASSLIILSLLLAGYFLVYVTSPYDLRWTVATSLNRLLVQVWPSLLLIFFIVVNPPEQAMNLLLSSDKHSTHGPTGQDPDTA